MTLLLFYAEVSRAIRRGTSVDTLIPDWASNAALWLEQNYTFQYMKRTLDTELDPLAADPNLITLEDRVKKVEFVRARSRQNADVFGYLQKVEAGQIASIDEGDPSYYWMDGMEEIWLDAKVQTALTMQVRGAFYTDWPTDTAAVPSLLRYYKNLLKAQTLIESAIDLKDERMVQAYNIQFERALTAVLVAEEEFARENTEVIMRYAPST